MKESVWSSVTDALAEEHKETCGCCSNVVFRNGHAITVRIGCREFRGDDPCPYCAGKRNAKLLREIESERANGSGTLQWFLVSSDKEVESVKRNLSRYGTRYKRLPQREGTVFLIESGPNKLRYPWPTKIQPLTEDADELKAWIAERSKTPRGQSVGGTRGKKDENGNVICASWGYPAPKPKPSGKGYLVRRSVAGLKDYFETAGAEMTLPWVAKPRDYAEYKTTEAQQAAVLAALEEKNLVMKRKKATSGNKLVV